MDLNSNPDDDESENRKIIAFCPFWPPFLGRSGDQVPAEQATKGKKEHTVSILAILTFAVAGNRTQVSKWCLVSFAQLPDDFEWKESLIFIPCGSDRNPSVRMERPCRRGLS